MKYISRLTALLLAMALMITSAGAELTLDGLTQDQLDALYTAASDETEEMSVTGVLGATEEFTSTDATAWADLGYTLQWYAVDAEGTKSILSGLNTDAITVTYTMEAQRFTCIATDGDGLEYASPVYSVQAQTDDIEAYLDYLYYEDQFYTDSGDVDTLAVYNWMTGTWNVALAESTLAEAVVAAWWAENEASYFDPELLCSCVVSGAAASDACMLHPDDDHAVSCGWYSGSPVLELTAETDAAGDVVRYILTLTDEEGAQSVVAMTEKLDGVRHYFKDVASGLFVAWLYTDENGDQWIVPLTSENEETTPAQ